MYKLVFNDGISICDDEELCKRIIKNLKKINGISITKELDVAACENGGYSISDFSNITVSKMNKNEIKYLKESYPSINFETLDEILTDSIKQNDDRLNSVDAFFDAFENDKFSALAPSGKNAEKLNSFNLNDDFYLKLLFVLMEKFPRTPFNRLDIKIDNKHIERMRKISKGKPLSFFRDIIIKNGFVPFEIAHWDEKVRLNDLKKDDEVLNSVFSGNNVIYSNLFSLGTFFTISDNDFVKFMKKEDFHKELHKELQEKINYKYDGKEDEYGFLKDTIIRLFESNYKSYYYTADNTISSSFNFYELNDKLSKNLYKIFSVSSFTFKKK